jgi:hypothetical protein
VVALFEDGLHDMVTMYVLAEVHYLLSHTAIQKIVDLLVIVELLEKELEGSGSRVVDGKGVDLEDDVAEHLL